jgi:peptidoglycan biosynthesis protein MviN/MurJ (putative lipid II flippase)
VTDIGDDATAVPAASGVRRGAQVSGGIGVVALLAAVVLYAVGGPPYGVNIGAGALYLLGLLAGLVASVLLWMQWGERRPTTAPGRLRWGIRTTTAALIMVSATAVVSLSHVVTGTTLLVLMGITAALLAVAVLLTGARGPA